jgi:ABC transporter substrate binding protein
MKRRDVLPLLVGAMMAVPRGASAQTPAKTYRLASLTAGSPVPVQSPNGAMLFSALAKNGYTLGQNLEYQPYGAAMQLALLPQLAKDIAANKVDAAVVLGYPAAAAMKDTGIPTVVVVGAGDPVATGLINSLAHPGGNITGISDNAATLSTKLRLTQQKLSVSAFKRSASVSLMISKTLLRRWTATHRTRFLWCPTRS